jgi:hypothetical protein
METILFNICIVINGGNCALLYFCLCLHYFLGFTALLCSFQEKTVVYSGHTPCLCCRANQFAQAIGERLCTVLLFILVADSRQVINESAYCPLVCSASRVEKLILAYLQIAMTESKLFNGITSFSLIPVRSARCPFFAYNGHRRWWFAVQQRTEF